MCCTISLLVTWSESLDKKTPVYLSVIIFGLTYSGNRNPWNNQEVNRRLWTDIPECQTLINTENKSYIWRTELQKCNHKMFIYELRLCLPFHPHKWYLQGCFCRSLWRRWLELGSRTSCWLPLPASPRHFWCTGVSGGEQQACITHGKIKKLL